MSGAQRVRLAFLRSTKETGEAFSRIFKSDEQLKVATPLPFGDTLRGNEGAGGSLTASVCPVDQVASLPPMVGADTNSSYGEKKCEGRLLHDAPFVRASLSFCDTTGGGSSEGEDLNAIAPPASRLEESEGWFIADLIEERDEKEVFVASEDDSRHGSMVMVPSVGSLSSMEKEEDEIRACADELNEEEGEELVVPLLFDRQVDNTTQRFGRFFNCSSMIEAIEHELSTDEARLLSKESEINAICAGSADRNCASREPCRAFYNADAGEGWDSFASLQELLDFLRKAVKMYGSKALRSMRFWIPVAESEKFLDQLEEIAPYTVDDFIRASKAATAPMAFTVLARQCLMQLTEYVLSWGAVEGAAAAAAAGETTAAAGATAVAGICSTFATVTLVVVAGVGVYAVVRFVKELTNVRGKLVVDSRKAIDVEAAQESRCGSIKHCLIMWK